MSCVRVRMGRAFRVRSVFVAGAVTTVILIKSTLVLASLHSAGSRRYEMVTECSDSFDSCLNHFKFFLQIFLAGHIVAFCGPTVSS